MNFSYFLYIDTAALRFKTDTNDFFGYTFVLKLLGHSDLKRHRNEVFQVLSKANTWNFSDFLHEVTTAQRVTTARNDFLG